MSRQLVIQRSSDVVYLPIDSIVYIESDHNSSNVVFVNDDTLELHFQLGQIEAMIKSQLGKEHELLPRVGRTLIVNAKYVHCIDLTRQRLILSDCARFTYTLQPSLESLQDLIVTKNKLIFNGML